MTKTLKYKSLSMNNTRKLRGGAWGLGKSDYDNVDYGKPGSSLMTESKNKELPFMYFYDIQPTTMETSKKESSTIKKTSEEKTSEEKTSEEKTFEENKSTSIKNILTNEKVGKFRESIYFIDRNSTINDKQKQIQLMNLVNEINNNYNDNNERDNLLKLIHEKIQKIENKIY